MQPRHIAQALFGATARQIQGMRERLAAHPRAFHIQHRHHEELFDRRHRRFREFAADRGVGGDLAPAGDRQPDFAQRLRECAAYARMSVVVIRHEYDARGVTLAEGDTRFGRECAEKSVGCFQEQTAAIARQAVGGDTAAVGHPRQGIEGLLHQARAGFVVELGDQPKAAGIALVARIVEMRTAGLVAFHRKSPEKMTPG